MAKLKDFIVRTKLENTDKNQKTGYSLFDTEDYVFFETKDELENLSNDERIAYPSDYAVMNGALLRWQRIGPKDRQPIWHWLRSAYSKDTVDGVSLGGPFTDCTAYRRSAGLCPAMHLNLSSVISARRASPNNFKIEEVKDKAGKVIYHTIEFGSYPQDKAKEAQELERLFNAKKLTPTGKTYTGYMKGDGSFAQNQEFEYGGKKYVRVISIKRDDDSEYKDKTKAPEDGTPMWAEVQPIKWKIKNWDELPRSINPNGKGTAKTIYVKSEEGIMSGIPFYPEHGETEHTMWQNSVSRALLNGYDLHAEIDKGNGYKRYKADKNFDFKGKGFIEEAFGDMELVSMNGNQSEQIEDGLASGVRRTRLQKLNPDKTPEQSRRRMTDTEMIKTWIDQGRSVLLKGPSGIGKTERIRTLYPDCIYIKLTNNMFPEKVAGSMNLQTGQELPPSFAKEALLQYATPEERKQVEENVQYLFKIADEIYERSKKADGKVVILLDELLNVKPQVQNLVFTLVLNRFVEIGRGLKLPANTVVVATGNQKKYSAVAEDLAEPLAKRFDHTLDMMPKVGEWLTEYALPNKIHPSVIGYIFSKYQESGRSEQVYKMGYFYEEPEVGEKHLDEYGCVGRTNDPRGWTSISNALYAFEEDLQNGKYEGKDVEEFLKTTLNTKLRDEWAGEFYDFYNNPTVSVEDVVNRTYTQADLPQDVSEKFATLASLLSAGINEVGLCREFIRKYCDPEYMAVYDIYWVANDPERMEKIAELKALSPEQEAQVPKTKTTSSPKHKYKITVDEFRARNEILAIHCDTKEKAEILCRVFDKMGKKWSYGESYLEFNQWLIYRVKTCYTNEGHFDSIDNYNNYNASIYEFEEVDLEKYLSPEDKSSVDKILSESKPENDKGRKIL